MCDITSENFYSELPAIEEAIKGSTFVCLDMEFSKLHESISNPFSSFDSVEDRYCKLRDKVSDINCIQLGLATFCYDSNNKIFKTTSYSFFTYPRTFYKSDSVVVFQTSCIEFLTKHKFDFNKLFCKSVPYMTDEQELTIMSEMQDELFFDKYFEDDSKFRSIHEELNKVINSVSEWYDNVDAKETIVLEMNGLDEPYMTLMQYYLVKQFEYISIDESREGLIITKTDEENAAKLLKSDIYENLKINLLRKMLGIKYVLKLVSKWKKPIVGHNCALDILILCNQFFIPLPKSFKDYKHFMHNNFGPIYDTKLLCQQLKCLKQKDGTWIGSSLSELYFYFKDEKNTTFSKFILVELPTQEISIIEENKFHQAGWDAYFTGYCFVRMIQLIKKKSIQNNLCDQIFTITELFKSIEFCKNKLYTYRSVSKCLDLDPNNSQDKINYYLIIQNRGILYKKLDLAKLKVDLKEVGNHIDVKPLSNYSTLVAPPTAHSYDRIFKSLKSKYKVEKYSQYQSRIFKQQIFGFTLGIICTIAVVTHLKK